MKFYNERAKKVYPGLKFTMTGFELRYSRFLDPVKQVVVYTSDGDAYYMPGSFCRFVANTGVELDTFIGDRFIIIERETFSGRTALYVEAER